MHRVLVCAATRAERDACQRGILASAQCGREVLLTGVGPLRAARSLAERLARGSPPQLVVSSGFACAVSPTLERESWISGVRVDEWNGVARLPVEGITLVEGPAGLMRCDVVSSSVLLSSSVEIPDGSAPLVVDMESAALAREASLRGIAFAVVRLISDTPAQPLPPFVSPLAAALAATTTIPRLSSAGRGLRGAFANPRQVVRLVRESSTWLRGLEDGWKEFALWPLA